MAMDKELNSLLAAIEKSDYSHIPYEHFYMTDIFSEEFYNEIIEYCLALNSNISSIINHHHSMCKVIASE